MRYGQWYHGQKFCGPPATRCRCDGNVTCFCNDGDDTTGCVVKEHGVVNASASIAALAPLLPPDDP